MRTIWWDMDGTIADFYGVENWLPKIRACDASPYTDAKVMWNMSQLARLMNRAQMRGYKLGIISWLAKNSTEDFDDAVVQAKKEWLNRHLASVKFDHVVIVAHGVPKYEFMDTDDDILFDDEEGNRDAWLGQAFEPNDIIKVLKHLLGMGW